MAVQLTYPGVYIEEIPSGVRTITGVATSITAFVGRAARGLTGTPVTITSFADFERAFGGLWKDSSLGFAVRDFYLNGGSTAVIVRLYKEEVVNNAAKPSKASLPVGSLVLQAVEEGAWGNALRAIVDFNTRPFDASLGETSTSLFNLFVRDGTTGLVEEHRNVVVAPADHPRLVSKVLENESRLARATSAMGGSRPGATGGTVDPGKTVWDDNAAATNVKVTGNGLASDGVAITSAEFDGVGFAAAKNGLYALEKADLFNLLVHPSVQERRQHRHHGGARRRPPTARSGAPCYLVDGLPTWDEASDVTTAYDGLRHRPRHGQPERRALLPAAASAEPAAGQPDRGLRRLRAPWRASWRAPTPSAASGRRRPAWTRRWSASPSWRSPLTDAENGQLNPLGVNCLRACPGRRPGGVGRADAAGRRPARRRSGSTSRCAGPPSSSRRASTAARSGSSSSPTTSRCGPRSGSTSAPSCTTCSGRARSRATTPARGLLRQVRQRDDDAERHRPRDRQHPRRLRPAEAGRVRRHPAAADGRPDRRA